nr:early endosome antigen 1-like [Ipomoea batatas]
MLTVLPISTQICNIRPKFKHKRLVSIAVNKRKNPFPLTVRSVLDSKKSIINGNGATESAGILLQRLFDQKQKLEEQIGRDPNLPQVAEFGQNLGKLESDLQAALVFLKKKEEDLQDAERKVLLEYNELSRARVELENREVEIAAASSKQEKLEDELRLANLSLASRAMEIEDLKFRLQDRDHEIAAAQMALSLKEGELNKMKNDLIKKSEEAANAESELRSKSQLLDEANGIVNKQKAEIQDLQKIIQEKEKELEVSLMMQKTKEDKLKVAEANLEKQTIKWLVAQEELKKLAEATSKHSGEGNETFEDFKRVRTFLADVRSELLSSRQALASSRQKMKDQERLLEEQLKELDEQRRSVMSYMSNLKDVQIEVDSEKLKLRLAEAQKKELERDLSLEKELVQELQNELNKERSSLQEAIEEMSSMQRDLDLKKKQFVEVQNLLQVKESELVEARLEIQHFKSEQASLQLMLEEKDSELLNTRKMFDELKREITELRMLLKSKEDKLIQATTVLKERDEEVQTMHHELKDTKLKFSEAETVVERILELTNKLVISSKDDQCDLLTQVSDIDRKHLPQLLEKPANSFKWQKRHLENELELTRENLRTKDMELLSSLQFICFGIIILKSILGVRNARQIGLVYVVVHQDSDELKQLYALVQEKVGESSLGDLAVEKLQLEAAQLEVEAATSALQMLSEMSRDLLSKASSSLEADYAGNGSLHHISESNPILINNNSECLAEVHAEVAQLSALTEQLVREAGIVGKVY